MIAERPWPTGWEDWRPPRSGRRSTCPTTGMWSSGETVVVRYRSIDGRFRAGRPLRVVDDSGDWLVTYLAEGTPVAVPVLADGRGLREVPLEERWRHPARRASSDGAEHLLMLFPRGRAFSLWLFRENGGFRGWYVNLEDAHVFGERRSTRATASSSGSPPTQASRSGRTRTSSRLPRGRDGSRPTRRARSAPRASA